jgi:hypothetical protein
MFRANYVYILFHGFYVLNLVVYHCNRFIGLMDFDGDSFDNDARCREREEEHQGRKGKIIAIGEGRSKKSSVSCNYILYDYYIMLKNMFLFYEELHL